MEYIKTELIRATATRLEAIENRVSELGVQNASKDEDLRNITGFRYKKGSNKATFNGVISSQTFNYAKEMLEDMENEDEIHISINSPGGSAVTGVALCNLLNEAPQRIVATASGQAYSAAGVMMQGADERRVAPGSYIGIHRSWCNARGNEQDFSQLATELRKNDENILEIFSSVVPDTKLAKVKELMEKDTALTGKEAVELGLADKVTTRKTNKTAKKAEKEEAKPEVKNEAVEITINADTTDAENMVKILEDQIENLATKVASLKVNANFSKTEEIAQAAEDTIETKSEVKQEAPRKYTLYMPKL